MFSPKSFSSSYGSFPAGANLNFESLQQKIISEKVSTLPELLKSLKNDDPQLFEQYLLAYRSRSLQESSALFPRVLLVANDGKFILAFNGNKNHSGFNRLETMEFKEEGHKFVLREIEFKAKGQLPHFSEPNPTRCLSCHQSPKRSNVDPRPNWEPYAMWPGFYGSSHSSRNLQDLENDFRLRKEDRIIFNEIIAENSNLDKFEQDVKTKHRLYRFLGGFDRRRTVSLTKALSDLNLKRLIRLMSENSSFLPYKAVFFSALKCDEVAWPESVDQAHREATYLIETQRIKSNRLLHKGPGSEFLSYGKTLPSSGMIFSVSQILTAIFEPLAISTEDWSMDFRSERGRFAFFERFGGPDLVNARLLELAYQEWPEYREKGCGEIKKLAYGQNYNLSLIRKTKPPTGREVVRRCLTCHGEQESQWSMAPAIRFDSKSEMGSYLKKNSLSPEVFWKRVQFRTGFHATLKEQMPPNGSLNSQERKALMDYLKSVLQPDS